MPSQFGNKPESLGELLNTNLEPAPIEHVGLCSYRLPSNPAEAAFAEAWARRAEMTLGYLLHGQEKSEHYKLTQQEATVAATVIQWLGSPVGQGFLEDVVSTGTVSRVKLP